ncbi:hypothetical protein ABIB25_003583 [Nakamurella sp. UYEF19]
MSAGVAAAVAISISIVSVPLAHADLVTPGSYNTVDATRILDTRSGLGAPKVPLAKLATLTFKVTTGSDVPVSAVVLNVTAVNPTMSGFLTVYAGGATRPLASNLNFQAKQNVPNLVITPVSSTGTVSIYNGSGGTVDVLADIHGYYLGGASTGVEGTFVSLPSKRFLDSRIGVGAAKKKAGPQSVTKFKVAGLNGVPTTASAVVVNVTAVHGSGSGFVTAYPGSPVPLASTLNYLPNQDRANLALMEIGTDGTISLFNGSNTPVDLLADVTGYFVGGTPATDGTFIPSTPFRVFDSRGTGGRPAGALTISKIPIFPANDPTFSVFKAVVVNVTAVQPQASGFLTTWEGNTQLPSVSSSNFQPKQDVAGSIILPVNTDGTISIYNGSYGNVDYVVDVTGFFFTLPTANVVAGRSAAKMAAPAARIAAALNKLQQISMHPAAKAVSVSTTR